jgi:hypothetical protein
MVITSVGQYLLKTVSVGDIYIVLKIIFGKGNLMKVNRYFYYTSK